MRISILEQRIKLPGIDTCNPIHWINGLNTMNYININTKMKYYIPNISHLFLN